MSGGTMALKQTCVCTRYMSPTRFNGSPRHQKHMQIYETPSRSRTYLTQDSHAKWRSKSVGVATQFSHSSSSTQEGNNVLPSSVLEEKEGKLIDSTELRSVETMAQDMKEWAKSKSPQVVDVPMFAKLLASLNIELPKYFPKYQNYIPKSVKIKPQPPVASKHVQEVVVEKDITEKVEEQSQVSKPEAKLKCAASDKFIFTREQHDFEEAMRNTTESIQTYYSSIDLSTPRTVRSEQRSTLAVVSDNGEKKEPENILMRQLSAIKQLIPSTQGQKDKVDQPKEESKKVPVTQKITRTALDRRTRGLIITLRKSSSNASRLIRLEDLCRHLASNPDTKNVAVKEKVIPTLLRLRLAKDPAVRERAQEALGLVGYVGPVKARGVRVLAIDGGGTRGLMAIEMLRRIEELCGAEIPDVFDYVCGVSTGSLIAALVAVYRVPLDECEHIYKEFSKEMFNRSRVMGAGKLVLSHAYYDGKLFEDILKINLGDKTCLESMRDPTCPKMSAVSALSNQPTIQNHLFRNYSYRQGTYSHYPGSVQHHYWQAIRASSAAPGYYEEFKLADHVHTDGGLLTNNPTAIALHEAKLLWPGDQMQCVVSIGTGRFRPKPDEDTKYGSLKDKVMKFVQSATDTEAVHTMLQDLLPPSTYFRFNPYMSEELQLDEIRPDKWEVMKQDTQMYCRKNQLKFDIAAQKLSQKKLPHQKVKDWVNYKRDLLL